MKKKERKNKSKNKGEQIQRSKPLWELIDKHWTAHRFSTSHSGGERMVHGNFADGAAPSIHTSDKRARAHVAGVGRPPTYKQTKWNKTEKKIINKQTHRRFWSQHLQRQRSHRWWRQESNSCCPFCPTSSQELQDLITVPTLIIFRMTLAKTRPRAALPQSSLEETHVVFNRN